MLPIAIPAGTTLHSLFTDVVPAAHAKLVAAGDDARSFCAVIAVDGGASFRAEIRGAHMDVRDGEEADRKRIDFWMTFDEEVAQAFLDDWTGPQRFAPSFAPPGDLKLLTDPRVLRHLAMVSGKVELALTDFPLDGESSRIAMTIASGAAAKRTIDRDDPDVIVEATTEAFLRLLAGKLTPEEAIVDNHVTVRGKRLVAMQFALALAPFFPAR